MEHMSPLAVARTERLGLLLAGGGAAVRRAVAGLPDGAAPLPSLVRAPLPGSLLERARRAARTDAPRVLEEVAAAGWRFMVPGEPGYPEGVRELSDPPLGLFVRGTLPDAPAAAVVGSRQASPYGRQVARALGEELARAGVAVVSGMARGVDAAAHAGALAAGGPTLAVWGTGPDRVYPPEHRRLAAAIADAGALVTEFPPGTPPRRHHFPQRNRILAGLAQVVVVVEAAVRSGALVTARLALEEGREVLAVPGSIFAPLSLGPNALLRLGARPMLSPADVLEELGLARGGRPAPAAGDGEDPLLGILPPGEALAVDELAERGKMSVGDLLVRLVELEVEGRVERLPDGRFARR